MVFRPDHAAGAIAAFRQVQILTSRLSRAAVQSGNVFGINVRHLSLHGFRLFIHDTAASGLDRAFKAEAAADVPVGDIDFLPDCFNRFHFESPLYKFHEDYRIFPLTFDRSTGACRMQYNIYYIIIFK
jgi:hypothetical protein